MRHWFAALLVATAGIALPSDAQTLQVQCGPEAGRGFTTDRSFADGPDGWYSDKISSGETTIRLDSDTGDVEVRYKGAGKFWKDAEKDDDARIVLANVEQDSFMVLLVFPEPFGAIETYIVADIGGDSATLIHTTSRASSGRPIISRIMTGRCTVG